MMDAGARTRWRGLKMSRHLFLNCAKLTHKEAFCVADLHAFVQQSNTIYVGTWTNSYVSKKKEWTNSYAHGSISWCGYDDARVQLHLPVFMTQVLFGSHK
jgi:hypothetical protein